MVAHVIDRLSPQVSEMRINANQNLDRYRAMGYPVIEDAVGGFAGPLAGLHCGLLHCTSPWLVTAPCDSPFLPLDLVTTLRKAQMEANADLAVPVTGNHETRQPHPVFCLVRTNLVTHLTAFLESGGRKVDVWYSSLSVVEVHFDDESAFRNINTMAELHTWQPAAAP